MITSKSQVSASRVQCSVFRISIYCLLSTVCCLLLFGCAAREYTPGVGHISGAQIKRVVEPIYWKFVELEKAISKGDSKAATLSEAELTLLAEKDTNVLVAAIKSTDPSTRATAAAALGYLKDEELVFPLTDALNAFDPYTRRNAAHSLGQIGYQNTPHKELIDLLSDGDPSVRSAAAFAFIGILRPEPPDPDNKLKARNSEIIYALTKSLDDGSIEVRNHTIQALGALARKEAIISIAEHALKEKVSLVKQTAAMILGRFKDTSANPYLIEMLKDYDTNVVKTVAMSLRDINKTDFGGYYVRWREWYEEQEKKKLAEEKEKQREEAEKKAKEEKEKKAQEDKKPESQEAK